MTQPQRDHSSVDAGLLEGHGTTVTQDVRVQILGAQRRTGSCRNFGMGRDPTSDRVSAHAPPGAGRGGERDGALLATFAQAADVRSGAEGDVAAAMSAAVTNLKILQYWQEDLNKKGKAPMHGGAHRKSDRAFAINAELTKYMRPGAK